MKTRRLVPSFFLTLALVLAPGCSTDGASEGDPGDAAADAAAAPDTAPGADTATDTTAVTDTVADTAPDEDTATVTDTAADTGTDTAEDTAPDVVPPPWPPLTPEFCGSEPYEWLPPDGMGEVLQFKRLEPLHTFSAAQLDALLQTAGYGNITPVANGVTVYRLRYVTQDRGERREATAAVGIPDSAGPGDRVPIGLWMHHSVGFVDACAPSRDSMFALVAPALLASQGFLAVAPDLLGLIGFGEGSPEGKLHAYLVGEPTAIAGLDAVRATLFATQADETLPDGDGDRVVVAGGSQGGHGAFFVDRYAPHYAPELTITAVAAVVPPTDLRALATKALGEWASAARVIPTYLATMRNWYGTPESLHGLLTDVEPHFMATNIEDILASKCRFEIKLDGADELGDYFEPDFQAAAADDDWESLPPWDCYLAQSSVATSAVPRVGDAPFYVVFAENDELIDLEAERQDIPRLCEQGYRIEVSVCGGLAHTPGGQAAFPLLFDWLKRQVAGGDLDPDATCVVPEPIDCEAL